MATGRARSVPGRKVRATTDQAAPAGSVTTIEAHGVALAAYVVRPSSRDPSFPGLLLSHGFPGGQVDSTTAGTSFPELADRIAADMGWVVVTFTFRGAGGSEGDFSLQGWLDDLGAGIGHLSGLERVRGVWLAGFGTGGALSICAGAARSEVQGVAAMAAPADFDDWASHPRRLLQHARDIGLITTPGFPRSFDEWCRELRDIRPARSAAALSPRPLLLVHGSDDEAVPNFDARAMSDSHGSAELRIISGAGHSLRYDPRAVAVLLGWLDRQQHRVGG